jgi:NTP pyrophosphatase (non-canonical NTP hydrolase)
MNREKFLQLKKNVIDWANERNLLASTTTEKQKLKLISEVGELSDAILKNNLDEIKDAIGDCIVVLILYFDIDRKSIDNYVFIADKIDEKIFYQDALMNILYCISILDKEEKNINSCFVLYNILINLIAIGKKYELSIVDCLDYSYNQIKNRTGQIINGTFIKDN